MRNDPGRDRPASPTRVSSPDTSRGRGPLRGRKRSWLLALLAALLVLATEQVIEHFARETALEQERGEALHKAGALRARLEGVINANLFLIHGLTAIIESRPDIDQAAFSAIAQGIVDERTALRNIGAAPDLVLKMVYPLRGNESVIGLDYRRNPAQREAALRARDSGQPVIAGPLELVQGDAAIIAREPVFLRPAEPGGKRPFWGLVSAVIEVDTLYRQAGFGDPQLGLQLALRGRDGTGPQGSVFYGDADVFDSRPVLTEVTLPGGSWQLAAVPTEGWGRQAPAVQLIRLMGLLAAIAAGAMAWHLSRDAQQLSAQRARLSALLDNIPDVVWLKSPEGRYLAANPRFARSRGVAEGEVVGRTDGDFGPADAEARARDRASIDAETPSRSEEWITYADDGHRELLETIRAPVRDDHGNLLGLLGIGRDITERKRAEEQIRRLNRLYGTLSSIDEAILRLREPEALLAEACRIAHEAGGFHVAWISMPGDEGTSLRPLAWAGIPDEVAAGICGSIVPAEDGRFVCNDIASDPRMASARDTAERYGCRSLAVLSIPVGGEARGTFGLAAAQTGFFDDDELRLLERLARDLGYAIEFSEAQREGERLNRHMLDMLETMSDGFVSLDRRWCYRYVNQQAAQILSRPAESLLGRNIWQEFPEGVGQPFYEAYHRAMNDGVSIQFEEHFAPWDRWFENRIYPTADGISIFFTDITRRKRQEEELKRLNSTLNAVVAGSTDAIFVKDLAGRYVVGNKAIATLLGKPIDEIIGRDDHALFPEEFAARFAADDRRIMALPEAVTYQESVATATGTYSYLTTKGPLVIDGEVQGVFGIARDITERERQASALRESEGRLRLFIDHAPAALSMFDRQMRYLAVSRRWLSDYGLDSDGIIGRSHYEIFPEIGEDWKAVHRRCLAGEVIRRDEDCFERADGGQQWLRWEVRPWHGADDEIGGIVIFSEDITEQMAARALLEKQRLMLASSQQIAHVGSWEVDFASGAIDCSEETFRIYGVTPDDFVPSAEAFKRLVHTDDLASVERIESAAYAGEEPPPFEYRINRPDGEIRSLAVNGVLVRNDNGHPIRAVGTVQDITERKQMEEQIRQLNTELEERVRRRTAQLAAVNRELETFSYSVSHDLKAPLRGIDGYSKLLLDSHQDRLDEEGRLFLNNVRSGVAQMNQLIADLLAYSRMERRDMFGQPLEFADAIAAVLRERHRDIEAAGMVVELHDCELSVRADPEGLAMVLRNLIDNAIKFSHDSQPPRLEISAQRAGDAVTVELRDNGIGFEMQFHDRIFEVFQRLQRAEDYAGTGVGLAMCRRAMQRMGGRIWAESQPGHGACFFLELPA